MNKELQCNIVNDLLPLYISACYNKDNKELFVISSKEIKICL